MFRTALLLVFGSAAVAFGAPEITFDAAPGNVSVFDSAEFTVRVKETSARNPFKDSTLSVIVRDETGGELRIDGFCDSDDGSIHRLRFMPRKAGKYRVSLRYAEPAAGREHEADITATAADTHGPVRVDPAYPWHFIREGTGEPWYYNSTTTYQILAWDEATMLQSLERLAKLKVNRLRVALAGRTKGGDRWGETLVQRTGKFAFKMEPWPAARPDNLEDPGYDLSRFNLSHWRKAERLLSRARELDVQISIVFYVDGADKGVYPFRPAEAPADEERYYRYAAARFAAYRNLMWDITNEWHLFRDEAWVNRMGNFLRECDPYDHTTSCHGGDTFPFRTEKWCDFAIYQAWDQSGGHDFMLIQREAQAATGRPMPQVNEEYGYEDHYPSGWGGGLKAPARNADSRRRLAWDMVFAGAYQTTGERADRGTGRGPDTGGGWINGRGDDSMTMLPLYAHLMDFMRSFDWRKTNPSDGLLRGGAARILAEPGSQYAAWLHSGGQAVIHVDPGLYLITRFNPRTGESAALPQETLTADWKSPECPDKGDWAFLLKRMN